VGATLAATAGTSAVRWTMLLQKVVLPTIASPLLGFVLASYSALILMFCVHLLLVALAGLNPARFLKKVFPVLAFAFTSRTSAGRMPAVA
jgi:L-cystine uptake protein TcyP (sodium:dicarboxylate symporter family)